MGHPKALSPYSLLQLDAYLRGRTDVEPLTFRDLAFMNPKLQTRSNTAVAVGS